MDKNHIQSIISSKREQRASKESIYLELLQQGATVDEIESVYKLTSIEDAKDDAQKRTIKVILSVGSVLVAASVFSFVASNWTLLSKPEKVAVIIFFTIIIHSLSIWIQARYQMDRVSAALAILGTLIFGSGIFLLGQIFNETLNWPDGFILWMFGAMAVAWARDSYTHWAFALILSVVALIGHPFNWFDWPFGYQQFIFTSAFTLALSAVLTIWAGFRLRKNSDIHNQEVY